MAVKYGSKDTNAGPNKTPAPHRAPASVVTDKTGWPHPPKVSGYGTNGSTVGAVLKPGEAIKSDLDTDPPMGDSVKDAIIGRGVKGNPALLTEMASGNVRDHPCMKDANSGGAPSGKVK